MATSTAIRAAGGAVWRPGPDGGVELALVHRPRYNDWSLPKGKLHRGETALIGALREVGEEIGARVRPTRWLGQIAYPVSEGPKTVDYWAMRHLGGAFAANDEVDAVEWHPPEQARPRLTYDHDRVVIDALIARPPVTGVVVLVRHAKAGKRSEWPAADRLRPLDKAGREQARMLIPFLGAFGPGRVLAADRVRCVQTVAPAADAVGVPVEQVPEFADEFYAHSPSATLDALHACARTDAATVICSQGVTIPSLVEDLRPDPAPRSYATRKAAAWVLSFAGSQLVAADYYRSPAQLAKK